MRSRGHRRGRGGLRRELCPPRYPTVDLAAVTDKDNKVSDTKGCMKLWFKHDKQRVTSLHPSISPGSLRGKASRCETRETEAHGPSLKCVVRLPPPPHPPLLFPVYLPLPCNMLWKTQRGSASRRPAPDQGCVAVQRESKRPGGSLTHVDGSAELHTAMPIQCLPPNLPRSLSCPLPSPYFQGGVPEPCCQHVMSLPIVGRNDDQLYLEKSEIKRTFIYDAVALFLKYIQLDVLKQLFLF